MVTNHLVDIISYESYEYLGKEDEYRIDFLPYCKLKAFEKNGNDKFDNNILITHVRGEIAPHVTPEVDLSIFDKWKLVLAGDLHSHSNSQRNIVYPGSPLTTSFYRNKPKKGILKVDLDTLGVEFIDLNLPALIKLTVESKDDIVENTSQDFIAYDIVPKVEAIIEAKEDTVFHKESSREEAILAVLDAEESKKQEVIKLYVNIIRGRS
jgi:DNA repair exonuclease SbcCD nuclease subunit